MSIHTLKVSVRSVRDLSATAREVVLSLSEPLGFAPGAFVNVFAERDGKRMRRAYSISSDAEQQNEIALSIRRSSPEGMSPFFWEEGVVGRELLIMGPLGLNTAEKITRPRIFLFGFGIGVSVIKALAPYLLRREGVQELSIVTGSRGEDEILYKEFFEELAALDSRVRVRFAVSKPSRAAYPWPGYIQEHLQDFDFTGSSVYACGQGAACNALVGTIQGRAKDVEFLVESFD